MSKRMRTLAALSLPVLLAGAGFWWFLGFYSIEPLAAAPDGGTVIVWREHDEPFFNSADAACLARTGNVSLACRGQALSDAPSDRIVVRLPFQRWAHLQSTRGVAGLH
jgi:hypothetical protein